MLFPGASLFSGSGSPSFQGGAATSGDAKQGDQGVTIGGIQTGGTSGGIPQWALIAALALFAVFLLRG